MSTLSNEVQIALNKLKLSVNAESLADLKVLEEALRKEREAAVPVLWEIDNPGEGTYYTEHEPPLGDYRRDLIVRVLYATPPAQPVAVPDDYFAALVAAARSRADKAMRKFPQPNYVLNKVAEENGEVIKAVIHYTEGREEWANVEGEIIDNLAMLIRLVVEGDQVIGFTPPDACRAAMLQGAENAESRCGIQPAPALDSLPKNAESRCGINQAKAEPVSQPYKLPDGFCIMPIKLTAENGAKVALSGEFHVSNRIVCQSCGGEGCEDCNDEGGWDAEIPVGWEVIKRIYQTAVDACSLPAEPGKEG